MESQRGLNVMGTIENPDKFSIVDEISDTTALQAIAPKASIISMGWATVPVANTIVAAREAVEGPSKYCHTGLITKLSHVDEIGKKHSFKPSGEAFIYDLGNPEQRNVFRLEVGTISGNADGNDFEHKGRGDRISVEMYQPNIHYVTSLIMKVLEDSDKPLFLLEHHELLFQKVEPLIDPLKLMSLVFSEEAQTDSDGYLSKDLIIPDSWLPAPIIVMVNYGYDRREERSAAELDQDAFFDVVILAAEVIVGSVACALFPPGCVGILGWFGWAELAVVAVWLAAKIPLGGENNYGCWFGEGPYSHNYIINYKSDIGEISGLLSNSQQEFIKMLEDEKKQQDKNAQLLGGAIVAAIVIGFGAAAMFGGK